MITERAAIGKIEILENLQIQIREDVVIERDGKELIRTFNRRVVSPGDDVTKEAKIILDVTGVLWTAAAIKKFQTDQAKIFAKFLGQ